MALVQYYDVHLDKLKIGKLGIYIFVWVQAQQVIL
jgi:hypothetical protein